MINVIKTYLPDENKHFELFHANIFNNNVFQ